MRMEDTISQLESIRANSASFLNNKEPDLIWQKDIEALDEVIGILQRMARQSRWKRLLFRLRYVFTTGFRRTGGWK